jgi:hypothetical protein
MSRSVSSTGNARWPATPLYTLSINSSDLAKTIAGDGVLNVRLPLRGNGANTRAGIVYSERSLAAGWYAGSRRCVNLQLNTLADRRHSGSHYWIDSGSVYLK